MSRPIPKTKVKHKTKDHLRQKRHYSNNHGMRWLEKQDIEELKYRFFRDINDDGTYQYSTVKEFANTIAEEQGIQDIKKWLYKAIDSRPHKSIVHKGDWAKERHCEEGTHDAVASLIKKKIIKEMDLLGAGMQIAGSYTLWQTKADRILQEIEQHFGGRALLEKPSRKLSEKEQDKWENQQARRLRNYLSALNRALNLRTRIDQMMLEAMGWNRPQLLALIQKSNSDDPSATGKPTQALIPSRLEGMFKDVIQMQLEKARMYEMEIPEDLAGIAAGQDEEERLRSARLVGSTTSNGHGKAKVH